MRRVLVLAGLWMIGVAASVAVAFAAVGRVADRVAPAGGERLSSQAVARALGATSSSPGSGTTRTTRKSGAPPSTHRPKPTTGPGTSSSSTIPIPPAVTSVPPATGPGGPPATSAPPATSSPTTVAPHDTVTTSQGGTIWTRCSGADRIVFVAAVPKNGYTRTYDVEAPGGVEEWFQSDTHRSKIDAECSNGVVHAEVEEEPVAGGDGTNAYST